jgi:hypothetical protein
LNLGLGRSHAERLQGERDSPREAVGLKLRPCGQLVELEPDLLARFIGDAELGNRSENEAFAVLGRTPADQRPVIEAPVVDTCSEKGRASEGRLGLGDLDPVLVSVEPFDAVPSEPEFEVVGEVGVARLADYELEHHVLLEPAEGLGNHVLAVERVCFLDFVAVEALGHGYRAVIRLLQSQN